MNRILVFAVILAFCTPCAAQEMSVEKLLAQSEPAIQKQINQVLATAKNQTSGDFRSDVAVFQKIQKLKDSTADKSEIVKQIAIFAASPASREGRPLQALVVLHVLDLPPKIVIRVLAPYLDSENKKLRSFVRDWFQSHDIHKTGVPSLQTVNYQDYLDYVRRKLNMNEEVPAAFIEYLYERSPDRALIVFYHAAQLGDTIAKLMELRKEQEAHQREREKNGQDTELRELRKRFEAHQREREKNGQDTELRKKFEADQREREKNGKGTLPLPPMPNPPNVIPRQLEEKPQKEILLAEHIVSNAIWLKKNKFGERFPEALQAAKQQLSKLAEMDQWWVRLYVAEIMRRHRELRQADVLEKLSHDSNALVSKSAKSAAE